MGSICGGGGSSSQTTTQANSPPPQVQADYQGLINRATAVANTPYTPYPGAQVAPLSNQTNAGLANLDQYAYAAQPYLKQAGNMVNTGAGMNQTAAGMTQAAAAPVSATQFSGSQVGQYENPFTTDVIQATQNQFNNQNKQQAQFLNSQNIGAGAFGGDRAGVSQAVLAGQQQASQAPVIAGLNQANYNQALAEFNNQQQTNLGTSEFNAQQLGMMANQYGNLGTGYANLGGDYGNVGTGIQNAGVSGANQQIQAGMIPQTEQQAIDTAGLNNWNQGQAYPFQSTSFLGNMIEGIGSQSGGTAATTTPGPSGLSQALGAGTAIAGIAADLLPFSDIRTKENVVPVGKTFDGQTIHRFNYKGDPRSQIGLVAQEVERSHPDAVHKGLGGLRHLDYEAATRDSERGGFDGGGGVSPGSTYDLGVGKFSPSGALALMAPSSGAGAGTGRFGAGSLAMTPGGTIFGRGQTPVTIPGGGPSPDNPLPAGPSRQGYGPYTPAQPGPMLRPTAGVPSQAHGGRINRDIGGPTGFGNATFSGIPNLGFIDYSTPTAIAQGTGVPGPYSGLANIAFSSASQGGGSSDSVGGKLFGFNTLSPSQPNLSGAAPGTTFKPFDYQDPGANFQTAGAEASLGPHYFTTGKNGELVFGGQGTAPAGTAGATNLGELLSRPGGNLPTDTAKTENPPPPPAAAAPAAAADAGPTRGVTPTSGIRFATDANGNPQNGLIYGTQAHGGPGAGASGGGAGAGAWTGGRTSFQSGGFSGLDDPRYSYYTPMTGNARGAAYHPPVPSPSPSPVRPPIIRHIAPRRAPVRIPPTVRAQAPALPPPRPTAPPPATQPPMPLPDVTFPPTPERQFTAPRSVADPMSGTSGPSSGIAPYHSLLPSMGGTRGYTNDYPSDPDPDRAAGLDDLRDQLNERPGFNSGGVMGQWPLAAATGYTPQGQGITGFDSQGSSMGAGSVAKSAGAGFGDLFDGGSKASRTGFADGGTLGVLPGRMKERLPAPPYYLTRENAIANLKHMMPPPGYAEGEVIPTYRGTQEAPASPTPAPPPALAYPGDAQNAAQNFRSSQLASRPPILSSTNMPPAGRYAPATGFSPGLNNYMNLAPSTDLAHGGRAGFASGGLSGLGMDPASGVDPALQAVLQINSADPFKGLQPLPIGHGPPTPAEPKAQQQGQPFDPKGLGDSIGKLMGAFGDKGLANDLSGGMDFSDIGGVPNLSDADFAGLSDAAVMGMDRGGAVNGRVGAWGGPGGGSSGDGGDGGDGGGSGGDGGVGGATGSGVGGAGASVGFGGTGNTGYGGVGGVGGSVGFGTGSTGFGGSVGYGGGSTGFGGDGGDAGFGGSDGTGSSVGFGPGTASQGYGGSTGVAGFGGGSSGRGGGGGGSAGVGSGGGGGGGGGTGGSAGGTGGGGHGVGAGPGTQGFSTALSNALAAIRRGGGPSPSDIAALESAIRQGQIGFDGNPGVASLGVPGAMGGNSAVTGAAPSSPVSVSNIMAAAAEGVSHGMSPAAAIAAATNAVQRGFMRGTATLGQGDPSAAPTNFGFPALEGVSPGLTAAPAGPSPMRGGVTAVANPNAPSEFASPVRGVMGGTPGGLGGLAGAPSVANVAPSFSFDARGNMTGGSGIIPPPTGHGGRYRGGRTSFGLGGVTRPGFLDGGVGPGPPQPPEPADPAPVVAAPAPAPAPAAAAPAGATSKFDASGYPTDRSKATPEQRDAFNRAYAKSIGLNPDTASGVTKAEGLYAQGAGPSVVDRENGRPFSFGDFQMNVRNGMGTEALNAGIDPRDPNQWQKANMFAMDQMKKGGLSPWKGDAYVKGLGGAGGGGGGVLAYAGGDSNGGNPPDQNQQQQQVSAAIADADHPPDRKLLPPGIGDSLMAAGFAMMAGTSPHAMVNIGQGALEGMKYYQNQRQLDREWQKNEAQIQDYQSQARYRDATTNIAVQNLQLERAKYTYGIDYANWVAGGMQGDPPKPPQLSGMPTATAAPAAAPAPASKTTPAAPIAAPPAIAATPGAPAVAGDKPIPVTPGPLVGGQGKGAGPPVVAAAPAPSPSGPTPAPAAPTAAPEAPAADSSGPTVPDIGQDPDWQKGQRLIIQGNAMKDSAPGPAAAIIAQGQSLVDRATKRWEAQKAPIEKYNEGIAEANAKDEGEISTRMQARSTIGQAVDRMQTIMQTFTPEHFAEQKASAVAAISSLFGDDAVTASGLAQAANAQEFGKDAKNLVMKAAKEQGGRLLASEIATLEKASAAVSQQPGAAAAILAQTKGLLNWADARDSALLDWRDKNPTANEAKFDREWRGPKHPENQPQAYVDKARKNFPYKGDMENQTAATLEDGRAYMTKTGPMRWNAQKQRFFPYTPEQ